MILSMKFKIYSFYLCVVNILIVKNVNGQSQQISVNSQSNVIANRVVNFGRPIRVPTAIIQKASECIQKFDEISNVIVTAATLLDETIRNISNSELNFYQIDSTFQSSLTTTILNNACSVQIDQLISANQYHSTFLQCVDEISATKQLAVKTISAKLNIRKNQIISCETVSLLKILLFHHILTLGILK